MVRRDRKVLIMTLGAASALLVPMSLVAPAPAPALAAPAHVPAASAQVPATGADGSAGGAEGSAVSSHWLVQSSAIATGSGADISAPGFHATGWLPETTDDAGGGLTEIGALTQNGQRAPGAQDNTCSSDSIFFSHNMLNCFGQGSVRDAPANQPFTVPWWFRTDFQTPSGFNPPRNAQLIINGVVGQADVWVNGQEVATQQTVMGDYAQYTFDIGKLLSPPGQPNSLALEVSPNNPRAMLTLDTVDWNQPAPDNNTGIQFPVQIDYYGALQLNNAHVVEDNASDMSSSRLTVKGDVTNSTGSSQSATVSATVKDPQGKPISTLNQTVTVAPDSTQTVVFDPASNPSLAIDHPQLWWPYQMGGQPLYSMAMSVAQHGAASDTAPTQKFGIRTVTTFLTGASDLAPDGVRWFAVNGKRFVWRSGGWSEDLFLRYSAKDTASQIALIKSMGLQGIRTEGKEMPENFYQQFDKAGLIIDGGFQCCDRWEASSSNPYSAQDLHVIYLSALHIGQRLRDHPSVFNYSWSDNQPSTDQEQASLQGFSDADFHEPIIASAEYKSTPTLGPSGEKEGPYNWAPPSYWYDTTNFRPTDSSRTNVGGSWGFDSEASPGHTVPTLDSLNRFLSASDLAQLWQNPNAQIYHTDPDGSNNNFGGLQNEDKALTARYGPWTPNPTTATGDTTSGSTTISNVSLTSGLNSTFLVGEPINGPGIAPGTTIASLTLAAATGNISAGSNTITNVNVTAGTFSAGQQITSIASPNPFPGGSTITSINGSTWTISKPAIVNGTSISGGPASLTLSQPATATASGAALSGPAPVALSGSEGLGLGQWVEESQALNYETQRAIFEAFIDHSTNSPTPSTGLDYWQLNKGWPTLLWALYNNDYDQPGSYFGAQKANQTLHALYAYDNNTVTVDNLSGTTQSGLSVESKVHALDGSVLDDQTTSNIALPSQGVHNAVITPNVPAGTTPPEPAKTYFIELILRQDGNIVDRNVYWLSTQNDISIPNGAASPATTQYADMTQLQSLPRATVAAKTATGGTGNDRFTDVTLTNIGNTVAFLLRADLRHNCPDSQCPRVGPLSLPDNEILPVTYSDNDITLWPGESQTIRITYSQSQVNGQAPVVSISGWNLPGTTVPASAAAKTALPPRATAHVTG